MISELGADLPAMIGEDCLWFTFPDGSWFKTFPRMCTCTVIKSDEKLREITEDD